MNCLRLNGLRCGFATSNTEELGVLRNMSGLYMAAKLFGSIIFHSLPGRIPMNFKGFFLSSYYRDFSVYFYKFNDEYTFIHRIVHASGLDLHFYCKFGIRLDKMLLGWDRKKFYNICGVDAMQQANKKNSMK